MLENPIRLVRNVDEEGKNASSVEQNESVNLPAGWKTKTVLAEELGISRNFFAALVEKYRKSNPEYIKEYQGKKRILEYYSPELITCLVADLNKNEKAPSSWETNGTIAKRFRTSHHFIQNLVSQYRKSNPEYFKEYREVKMSRLLEHYSPELIKIIEKEIVSRKVAPTGWLKKTELAEELNIEPSTLGKIANKYRNDSTAYFGEFRGETSNQISEYYSPELIELIKIEMRKYPPAPDGWKTGGAASKDVGISPKTFFTYAEQYRSGNPEYFHEHRDTMGRVFEHYSPELIKALDKNFGERINPPAGWKNITNLASELEVSSDTIEKIVGSFEENEKYSKIYRDKAGSPRRFYSPEVIGKIKDELSKLEKAPDGWKTLGGLSKDLDTNYPIIERAASKYRQSNPEYFRSFRFGSGSNEYLSPELIKLITDEVSKFNQIPYAPKEWRTVGRLSSEIGIDRETIIRIISKYEVSNPEYFLEFKDPSHKVVTYLSPELIVLIKKESNFEKAPDGWETNYALAGKLNVNSSVLKRLAKKYKDNEGYFRQFKIDQGMVREHYSPELVALLIKDVRDNNEILEAPNGWETIASLADLLGVTHHFISKTLKKYRTSKPEYFKQYKHSLTRQDFEFISPELVSLVKEEVALFNKNFEAPEGWKTSITLAKEQKWVGQTLIVKTAEKFRKDNPEYFKQFRHKAGSITEHYSPELIQLILAELNKYETAPEGWKLNLPLSRDVGTSEMTVGKMANIFRETNPEYFKYYRDEKNIIREYYSPELVEILTEKIEKKNIETPPAPAGWKTNSGLSVELDVSGHLIAQIAEQYKKTNPEYFSEHQDKINKVQTHYSPELCQILKEASVNWRQIKEENKKEDELKDEFDDFIQKITTLETNDETAKKITDILKLLPGNAHDIIIKFHPKYKGLKPDYVKQVISEYLGDFLLPKNEWQPGDVQKLKEVMDIEGMQEEILLNLKNGCLTFVNQEKKNNPDANELALVEAYFEKKEMVELASSGIKEVEGALDGLREYYDAIFRLRDKKPGNIVDTLRGGRNFPDINQLVNIREITEKKKMLIADEMGLGKSASAILAKEYLGLGSALVVMPSNVEDTWKNYLSDGVNQDGKRTGYFKEGFAPKVLVIESTADLEKLKGQAFDYILISQEKMSGTHYTKALEDVDFDMMIIDEVHKLKNIESGVRSKAVDALASKIEGENKYLALLSGTPIPNKVKDIAITLKLLYPEKYKHFDSKEMVKRILYGDLVDLRSELLKRMQMKELATSIEMPPLTEEDVSVELAPEEREIYEILLEEDELTALDKILIFRQFLLNPEILKVEPGFVGSKIKKLDKTLRQDLETHNKIVVFVNGYVEGVIKGEGNIIQKLNLPEGTIVEEIHGEVSHQERTRIQNELKSGSNKTVVVVSGQTADVGVDFSGADSMIFYNEPWSKYDKKQQQARVYREGLKNPLTVKTLITKDSIEEGIRAYITAKEKAIEKLLKGIGNTDAEKKLLYNDSRVASADVETNAQLSKEYLSDWEKLMLHFGEGYESGEKRFREELTKSGKEYADLYKKLGRLTYQGNNARVSATLIERMVQEKGEPVGNLRILDIASGPEMLKEASNGEIRDCIFSTDINAEHFASSSEPGKTMSSSYLNLPVLNNSLDYANLGFAFHQTSPIKYYKKNYERLQVLAEMNRALKTGGRAVISMLHNVQFANMEKFEELVGQLGFKIVPEYTGEAKGGESYKAGIFTLEKTADIPEYTGDALKFDNADASKYIAALGDKLGREFLQGLEMSKTLKGKSRLRDQRRMIDKITLGGQQIEVIFNGKDRALLDEEVQSIEDGESLREQYGGIQNIPLEEIKRIGFERKLETPGYYLLYKIIKDGGAVIIRGDYKTKKKPANEA